MAYLINPRVRGALLVVAALVLAGVMTLGAW